MNLTVNKRVSVKVDTLNMALHVRHGDEDMPAKFPFRTGDMWIVYVDLATGKIKGWPGPAFDLYMKVCDEGTYRLLADGQEVAMIDGYVPNKLVPGEYGDYVDLKIAADGTITNWPKRPDLSAFERSE